MLFFAFFFSKIPYSLHPKCPCCTLTSSTVVRGGWHSAVPPDVDGRTIFSGIEPEVHPLGLGDSLLIATHSHGDYSLPHTVNGLCSSEHHRRQSSRGKTSPKMLGERKGKTGKDFAHHGPSSQT